MCLVNCDMICKCVVQIYGELLWQRQNVLHWPIGGCGLVATCKLTIPIHLERKGLFSLLYYKMCTSHVD